MGMAEETFKPLSAAELAEIDGRYKPFPPFSDWPKDLPNEGLWQVARDELQRASDQATEADLKRAQAIARRVAAFDTGAIEGLYSTNRGLTFTVAEQAALWEQKVDAQGPNARALFEAQLRAFELVLDHVTEHFPKLTQAWLRRIHKEITAPQNTYVVHTAAGSQEQPLPRGEYKKYPNHVQTAEGAIHAYAPVESTQSEMQRLIDEIEGTDFKAAHAAIQASYVHYALVAVHPFADGNGRLARAVASVYTYRAATIPLMVLNEHRVGYLAALADADAGDARPFVEVIERVTREALELVKDSLQTAMAPQPTSLLENFTRLYDAEAMREKRDHAARAFVDWLLPVVEKQIAGLDAPAGVKLGVQAFEETRNPPPDEFRDIDQDGPRGFRLNLDSSPPASASAHRRVDVFADVDVERGDVLLRGVQTPDEELRLARSDLGPEVSSLAERRIENFVQRLLGSGLDELLEEAHKQLGR